MTISIIKKEVWPTRWHMRIQIKNWKQNREFFEWMKENCADCMCVRRYNSSEPYWELRGGDRGLMMLIIMRWIT